MQASFKDPQGTARAKVYWWWLNGHTDTTLLKEELRSIRNAGLGGVDIFEIGFRHDGLVPAGPAFMGDESLNTITMAIREAMKLGLEVGLNLASSWNAGGSWVTPEHAAKSLYFSKIAVDKPGRQAIKVPFPDIPRKDAKGNELLIQFRPDGKPVYSLEVAVLAIPVQSGNYLDTARIVNVSRYFDPKSETLNWQVPMGSWEIHRYVCSNSGDPLLVPSPNSKGPIIDHFDSTATRMHFMYFINRLKPVLGDFRKTALKNLYLASFEAKNALWTPSLAREFKRLNGYEVDKFLPYIFNKQAFDQATTERFRQDLNLTISELMINNHYRKGREIANSYGLNLISESGGPGPPLHNVPVEAIKALGSLDVPRGEFWINHARFDDSKDSIDLLMLVKEIAAASHLYQRKITELEAFTSFQNWQEGPGDMRPIGDRAFCEGMSRAVIHGFTHNPTRAGFPGNVYAAGTHFNVKTTWWPKVKPFNDYLARVSYLLQETDFVADVLYYYGNRVPNFGTPKNTRFAVGSGYDYEIINTEKLLKDLTVKDGLLTLPYGVQFKVLALDEIIGNDPAVLLKLEELAKAGAIITGNKPTKVWGPSKAVADRLWSGSGQFSADALKKGKVFTTPSLQILQALNVKPDFDYPDKGSDRLDYMGKSQPVLDYIHHRKGDLDFYFIRNTSDKAISRYISFRQLGKAPELWNPVTGETIPINIYNQAGDQVQVPLTFGPYGSYFVVFNRKSTAGPGYKAIASATSHPPLFTYTPQGLEFMENGTYELTGGSKPLKVENTIQAQPIIGAWDVQFTKGWGAPEKATFPQLISWTQSPDKGIAHYSGSGVYTKTFNYTRPAHQTERVYLDLGKVGKVADVWLNGKPLGITWAAPYRYDVTDSIKPGENTLRVEVINTWSNRIIGDINEKENYTQTNLKVRGSRELLWSETPLVESGLMGPVTIHTVQPVKITANGKL
ncbi:glycosyl hydrolase [Telluribacter sp. SYSU D00476]|uniref:glycosyl hydrolase n=1 Tax=Telluribacter sp. SYSU D00476 TaxID=2811430 RepID=UPI001FF5C6CB|nr:glycosyl hydrolase [Telluribacter sp. SYSU D00476]